MRDVCKNYIKRCTTSQIKALWNCNLNQIYKYFVLDKWKVYIHEKIFLYETVS